MARDGLCPACGTFIGSDDWDHCPECGAGIGGAHRSDWDSDDDDDASDDGDDDTDGDA